MCLYLLNLAALASGPLYVCVRARVRVCKCVSV